MKKWLWITGVIFVACAASATFIEKDPLYSSSPSHAITSTNIAQWTTAYVKSMQAPTSVNVDSAVAQALRANTSLIYVKRWNNMSGDLHVTTNSLPEGTINKYWTRARVDSLYAAIQASIGSNQGQSSDTYTKSYIDSVFASKVNAIDLVTLQYTVGLQQATINTQASAITTQQGIITNQQKYIDSLRSSTLPENFNAITDGATITYDAKKGFNQNVTVSGTRTMYITGDAGGKYYTLVVYQNGTSAADLLISTSDKVQYKMLKGIHSGNKILLNHDADGVTTITWFRKGNVRYFSKGDYE